MAQPLLKKADGRLFCSTEFAVFDCKAVENCGVSPQSKNVGGEYQMHFCI